MVIGIYNSATLVSANNELRRFIHKQALESRLLSLIGTAEMEKELLKTIAKITQHKTILKEDPEEPIELDEKELKIHRSHSERSKKTRVKMFKILLA
jgi:hypothetical protein